MWWLGPVASAQSLFCGNSALPLDSAPKNGEDGVPPEAVLLLDFSDRVPGCRPPTIGATLRTEHGDAVEVDVEPLDDRLVAVRPAAPLAPGYHVLELEGAATTATGDSGIAFSDPTAEIHFRVDPVEVPENGAIDPLDLRLHRNCNAGTSTTGSSGPSIGGWVRATGARGALRTRVVTDGVAGGWHTQSLLDGAVDTAVFEPVGLGAVELCVETQLLDWTLAESAGPRQCFTPDPCPPPPPPRGCSTSAGGSAAAIAAGWLALAARHRRRDR